MTRKTLHEKDREFLAWAQNPDTFSADLRAKWHELYDAGKEQWKRRVIERELTRRGEVEPI